MDKEQNGSQKKITSFVCAKCCGTTYYSYTCDNSSCPNQPCCGKSRVSCECNMPEYEAMSMKDYDELYLLQEKCKSDKSHSFVRLLALDLIKTCKNELSSWKLAMDIYEQYLSLIHI